MHSTIPDDLIYAVNDDTHRRWGSCVDWSMLIFGDYDISFARSDTTKYREHTESTNTKYGKISAFGSKLIP